MNVDVKDIDPNSKTIETDGGFGIITEGKHKGLKFIKDNKGGIKILGFDEKYLQEMLNNLNLNKKDE